MKPILISFCCACAANAAATSRAATNGRVNVMIPPLAESLSGGCALGAVSAGSLGRVQRPVGAGDERGGEEVAVLQRGAADADRHLERAGEVPPFDFLAHALGDRLGTGDVA